MAERGRKTSRHRQVTTPNQPCKIKLLMIGNLHTGKTTLVKTYCSREGVPQVETPTTDSFAIGLLDCMDRVLEVGEQEVTVEIWDTAGTETYDSITASYYRGADGVCLTYSIADNRSFDLLNVWMGRIQENTRPHTPVLLLGQYATIPLCHFSLLPPLSFLPLCHFCHFCHYATLSLPPLLSFCHLSLCHCATLSLLPLLSFCHLSLCHCATFVTCAILPLLHLVTVVELWIRNGDSV